MGSTDVKDASRLRKARWYFGGLSSAAAACLTHPLDLLKVHMQTQQQGKVTIMGQTLKVVKSEGVQGLYNGLSASLLRQLTYSTTRFGIYEVGKNALIPVGQTDISFLQKVLLAGVAGGLGGVVGTPGDLINVRMQNDIKLPPEKRRNYKHAIDGIFRIIKEEGFFRLFSGASTATSRAIVVTIGQLSFYDQVKTLLIQSGYFGENEITYLLSSLAAGGAATFMTQPLDVIKTRQMNAKPGEFKNIFHLISYTAKLGPAGFFKGFTPAFVRLGPHTVLMFLILEQLRKNFGYLPDDKK